jgi:hypothetical protein
MYSDMTVARYRDVPLFESYYRPDRFKVYKGLPNLKCRYRNNTKYRFKECGKCSPIPFDMEIHLYDHFREDSSDYWGGEIGDGTFDSEIESMKEEAIRDRRYFGCEDERA